MSDTATTTSTKVNIDFPSMWKVILHNDDFTPMDFVVQVLTQIFNKSFDAANDLMMEVHEQGKAVVGTYTKEVATTKVFLTIQAGTNHGHPLLASMEET